MKTFPSSTFALAAVMLGLLTTHLQAQLNVTPPTLDEALKLKGGKALVLQPVQMKRDQKLVVTHAAFTKLAARPRAQFGVMLVVYSTDTATHGHVLYQDIFIPPTAGAGPHVKVFDGFTPAENKGIIAILIGLLLPAVNVAGDAVPAPLPAGDSISAEIHDPTTGIGMLLPAVQKVREAASR